MNKEPCPEVKYHLLCDKCGYDRWSADGFEVCPICHGTGEKPEQEAVQSIAKELTNTYYDDAEAWGRLTMHGKVRFENHARELLAKLQSLGVIFPKPGEKWVQLDEDQELPSISGFNDFSSFKDACLGTQQDMLKANFCKVKEG